LRFYSLQRQRVLDERLVEKARAGLADRDIPAGDQIPWHLDI
jgi:hypothetical protein